ncbi:MAG TPA: ABC transporter ATP-binding protein [Anaerolineae bacterium]|nr:ABC transporter ATP-binding protein [Anaerolineae bacterium]
MILQVKGVSKWFGGLEAVSNVTLDLPEGEILGLIGPNGAGKTTLFNVINGIYPPESGTVTFRGQDITAKKPYRLAKMGMARTHQIVQPLNELSVEENVMVGACYGREDHSLTSAAEISKEVLDFVDLSEKAELLAASLNVAQKKRLELARALASRPHLLLLDEVLAGLNHAEITAMLNTIGEVRDQGVTIIMIEHVMHAVMNISDRIIVIDYGKQIAEGTPNEVSRDPKVIEAYLGDPKLAEQLAQSSD